MTTLIPLLSLFQMPVLACIYNCPAVALRGAITIPLHRGRNKDIEGLSKWLKRNQKPGLPDS